MNNIGNVKNLVWNKLKDDIRKILHKEEPDPWNQPEKPKVTEEEIEQAIEDMNKPKPSFPWWKVDQVLLIPWAIIHFIGLYVMMGSPLSGGFLVYVIVSLYFSSKYFLLIRKVNRK